MNQEHALSRFAGVVARLPRYLALTIGLLRDKRLPRTHRAVLLAALGYNVSPVDLVPGFIPVAGQLDDLAVLLGGLKWVLQRGGNHLASEHLRRAGLTLEDLDRDLAGVRETAGWLGGKGRALVGATARASWRAVQGMARLMARVYRGDTYGNNA